MSKEPSQQLKGALAYFTRPRVRPSKAEELDLLRGAQRTSVRFRDIELAVWTWGEGPTVLLVHGWESRASHMVGFVRSLVSAGFSVAAMDCPAHGESQGQVTDVVDMGASVVAVAASIGVIHGLIAHSAGSAAALYAMAHGVKVRRSVHICGPASLRRVIHHAANSMRLDTDARAQLVAMMENHLGASLDVMELEALQAAMDHPALILHDPQDPEMPFAESECLAKAWRQSELLVVKDVGHRQILQDPAIIEKVCAFIVAGKI